VKIGVVAHNSRSKMAFALEDTVDADFLSLDDGKYGAILNHLLVWQHIGAMVGDDEWGIVLEDDAVPVDDFRQQVQAALDAAPQEVVSLYLGRQRPADWVDRVGQAVEAASISDVSWIIGDTMLHAVGIALRGRELIQSMLHATVPWRQPMDEAVTMWCRYYGHVVAFTWPSLVDHADQETVFVHPDGELREPGRVAYMTGARDKWTARAVVL
jgi:hypothetical protein